MMLLLGGALGGSNDEDEDEHQHDITDGDEAINEELKKDLTSRWIANDEGLSGTSVMNLSGLSTLSESISYSLR